MNGFHVEGMTQDKGDVLLSAEISDPVPGEHTLYSDHDVLPEGSEDAKKGLRICLDVLVKAYLTFGIEDTDVYLFGV